MGITSKIMRVIRSLSDDAYITVRSNGLYRISEGALEGELLSPLLFALVKTDLEHYFREPVLDGFYIDGCNYDILLLLYADDLVISSDSESDLKIKLRTLSEHAK